MGTVRTSIVHQRTEDNAEKEYVNKVLKIAAGIAGAGFGIYGAVRLTKADLFFPNVSPHLAQHLPLGFYQGGVVPLIVGGSFSNYFHHLGIVIDIVIDRINSFPKNPTKKNIKEWIKQNDITNVSDIIGALFGLALSGAFIYYNATSNDPFFIPFNASAGVPKAIMAIGAPLYMPGACANLITYCVAGMKVTVYASMDGIDWIVPQVQRALKKVECLKAKTAKIVPGPVFDHDDPNVKITSVANFLMIPGTLAGLGYGIYGAVKLQRNHLSSFPYLSNELADHLPLGFYQSTATVFIGGTFVNYYSHLGIAIDITVNGFKTFPWKGTCDEITKWFKGCEVKNAAHVFGSLFGLALSGAFIYYNATSNDPFSLPFGAERNVPDVLLQMGAPLYIAGACSNICAYFTETTRHMVAKSTYSPAGSQIKKFLTSFSLFKKAPARPAIAPPPRAVPHPI